MENDSKVITKKAPPKTIAIMNLKGGVGKTTITWCLGDYITTYPKKNVLLFDLDAQMSLTQAIDLNKESFLEWDRESRRKKKTIFNAILEYINGQEFNIEVDYDFMFRISKYYHFVPSNEKLYYLEIRNELKKFNNQKVPKYDFMRYLLGKITNSENAICYDYALFDCPPSFTSLSYSILSCCDLLLIPVNPDYYAVRGVPVMIDLLTYLQNNSEIFCIPKIAVFMNKAEKSPQGNKLTKYSQYYWDEIISVCKQLKHNEVNIRCFDSHIYQKRDMKMAVAGKRELPSEFIPAFKDLWNDIEEFLYEQ